MNDWADPEPDDALGDPIPRLSDLTEEADPEFLDRLERAIGHREAASAIGHVHSVGLVQVLFSYLESCFRVLFGDSKPRDEEKP